MIVDSKNIEFGYELISVLPFAYNLHLRGILTGTRSGNDTECLYYFSPKHEINTEKRSWYNTNSCHVPNISIHNPDLQKDYWTPPPLKEQYSKNNPFKDLFKKPLVVICNRHNKEWGDKPINFFDIPTLDKLINILKDEYQIIYINLDRQKELFDNEAPIQFGDYDFIEKNHKEVIFLNDIVEMYGYSYNLTQLYVFALCEKFITMNGGLSILASYFGGTNIIYTKKEDGHPHTKEILPTVNSFHRWYGDFGGSNIKLARSYEDLFEKVQAIFIDKQPLINILTRTSGRPSFFNTLIESIKEQDYQNWNLFVSIDNEEDNNYTIKHPCSVIRVKTNNINPRKPKGEDYGIFFPYNLYLNELQSKVNQGYIMYLDDDDKLSNKDSLKTIANNLKEDAITLWSVKVQNKIYPEPERFGKTPQVCHISGIGFAHHSSNKIYWTEWKRADYRVMKELYSRLNNIWINDILTETQSNPGFGLRQDKEPLNHNIMDINNKIKLRIINLKVKGHLLPYNIGDEIEVDPITANAYLRHRNAVKVLQSIVPEPIIEVIDNGISIEEKIITDIQEQPLLEPEQEKEEVEKKKRGRKPKYETK